MAQDRIVHMLAAWPNETDVGENMRLDTQCQEYLRAERDSNYEFCWEMLLKRLNMYRTEPAEQRRRAESLWSGLYWPGDIDQFNTLVRRAVTALKKVHCPLPDHMIVLRYLELLPSDKAKMLEDPLRRPAAGWGQEHLISAAKELFSIGKAYDGNSTNGLPRRTQRAAWANDKKM